MKTKYNKNDDDDDEIQDFTLSNIRDLFVISKLKLILVFFYFFANELNYEKKQQIKKNLKVRMWLLYALEKIFCQNQTASNRASAKQ